MTDSVTRHAGVCELCGEPMPADEQMFKYHGYSGPCPPRKHPFAPEPPAAEIQNDSAIPVTSNALAAARNRKLRARRRWGVHRVRYDLSRAQLDRLEELGYLDPFKRGALGTEQQAFALFIETELGS